MNDFEKKLSSNIWKYTLILVANKRVFVAIFGAYYLTIPGVLAKEIGLILLVGNMCGFLFEIPSGYASDKFGHRQTLIFARIAVLLSTVVFLFAEDLFWVCVASALLSLGQAFQSGTGSAFMHETLRDLGREKEYTQVMGKSSSIGFAIPAVLMTLVPFLVSWSMRGPFVVGLVMDIIGLWASLALVAPRVSQDHIEEVSKTNFVQVLKEGYHAGFFRFALFSGLTSGILMAVGSFRAVYQTDLGVPIIYFGIFFGTGRAIASVMLAYSGKMKTFLNAKRFYFAQFILYAFMIACLGVTRELWVIVLLFVVSNAFTWGLSQLDAGYMLDTIRTSKWKATLLSVSSQIDSIFSAAACYGLGLAIGYLSYRGGFLILTLCYIALGIPLLLYLVRYDRRESGGTPQTQMS